MIQDLGDIDIDWTRIDTAATTRTGHRTILLRVEIEFTKEAVTQTLRFGSSWIVPTRDTAIDYTRTAIPATDALKGILPISSQRFIAHIEAAASWADISADTAT
jgi:hypothetical protein